MKPDFVDCFAQMISLYQLWRKFIRQQGPFIHFAGRIAARLEPRCLHILPTLRRKIPFRVMPQQYITAKKIPACPGPGLQHLVFMKGIAHDYEVTKVIFAVVLFWRKLLGRFMHFSQYRFSTF